MRTILTCIVVAVTAVAAFAQQATQPALFKYEQELRLVPFPREVHLERGGLKLAEGMYIGAPSTPCGGQAANDLRDELLKVAGIRATIVIQPPPGFLVLSQGFPGDVMFDAQTKPSTCADEETTDTYDLRVYPEGSVWVTAGSDTALMHGAQTLRQLIRANLREGSIPAVKIRDWPALKYRGFSDDITRGPSPRLEELKREVDLASLLRMNFFTYYLEYQYAFGKHPEIGPADGSLKPEELRALVKYAAPRGIEVVGNQQSFGHFGAILRHDKYKDLRETGDVLNPTNEKTYELLADLYAEQAPLLDSKLFNVCCDETEGLGKGPSKALADKIGVGGVYVQHMKRVHDLLADRYGKRMMMWGDIIVGHPDRLGEIPKDTIMLSWAYDPRDSFTKAIDPAIDPFAKAGYDFFVCPGVNCWSRILPDFDAAETNIKHYVRDGLTQNALGMLNTTWDDDGENFNAYNWHGIAWGAECAWNGSKTPAYLFNMRIGAVLYGEPGDEFGEAIYLLSKTHRLPAYGGMFDGTFWNAKALLADEAKARQQAKELLWIVQPAIEHLQRAQATAKVNADNLDYLIFGARRMELIGTRTGDVLDAAAAYRKAQAATGGEEKQAELRRCGELLVKVRDAHAKLAAEYVELWNRECRPYSLSNVRQRFDGIVQHYDAILAKVNAAKASTQPLPKLEEIGF